eukprot:2610736-Lingulodinium_polyedra.AAC.1
MCIRDSSGGGRGAERRGARHAGHHAAARRRGPGPGPPPGRRRSGALRHAERQRMGPVRLVPRLRRMGLRGP